MKYKFYKDNMTINNSDYLCSVATNAGVGFWVYDKVSDTLTYNRNFSKMLHYDENELGEVNWERLQSFIFDEDRKMAAEHYKKATETAEGYHESQHRLIRKNGDTMWVREYYTITGVDKDNNITSASAMVGDITELMRNIAAIKATAEINSMVTAMFSSNPNTSVLFNERFEPINCNPKAIKFFGFKSKEDLIENLVDESKNMFPEFQPNGRRSISLGERLRFASLEGIHQHESTLIINGEIKQVNLSFEKISFGGGTAYLGTLNDLTEIKLIESELVRKEVLLSAVNNIAELLLEAEISTQTNVVNKALMLLAQCIRARAATLWLNCDGTPTILDEWTQSGEKIIHEKWKYLEDKDFVFTEKNDELIMTVRIIFEDKIWGFLTFIFESHESLTVLQNIDKSILKSGALMIASAIIRNDDRKKLIEAKEKAEESTKAKTDFLSRMSHEIRTPMNAIIGLTSLTQRSNDIDAMKGNLNLIYSSAAQLLGIINDVLEISKIDANKIELSFENFSINTLIDHILNVISIKIEEKSQHIEIEIEKGLGEKYVYNDMLRVSQVLLNLLSNSNKFTDEGGHIKLKVSTVNHDDKEFIRFDVSDDGIGISSDVDSLFESFRQADISITRKYGGTGLGLTISKQIVELLGGTISAYNNKDSGSTFFFELPFTTEEIIEPQKIIPDNKTVQDYSSIDLSGKTILVAEDNEINLMIVEGFLEKTNIKVISAENGQRCLELYRENPDKFSLILMDIQMPIMDGLQAADLIRKSGFKNSDTIPIIALTANAFKEDEDKCYKAGMNAYIAKPFEYNEFLSVILRNI